MKSNKIFLIIALVIGSCAKDARQKYNTEICILFDRTDSININYRAIDISSITSFELNPWKSTRIEIGGISDVSINESKILTLPSENQFTDNPQIRELKIKKFKTDIDTALAQAAQNCTSSLKHSIIFPIVVSKFNLLAGRKSENKHLVICSNLFENSNSISFYDTSVVNRIYNDPVSIRKELLKGLSIASLQNIHVWLIYTPQSHDESNLYMQIANEIYRPILESKGAIVHIGNSVQ